MSSVPLNDAEGHTFRPDTFTRTESGGTVHMQAVVPVDPTTGVPNAATEATLALLKDAAVAIKAAVEALNGKTTQVDTSSVSGTVALDAPTLAALESISVSTGLSQPLTDSQLRASAVAVTGSVTADTGLAQPLTDAQLRASAVPVSGTVTANTGLTQPLTDAQLRASALPVSIDAGSLAALETIQVGNFPVTQQVSIQNPTFMRVGFAEVGSGLVGNAVNYLALKQTGSGMAVSQSGGNLVITSGTTINSETVIRSLSTFSGSLFARAKSILSQRIANNTFRLELADLVGENLSYTINSATSVTVTFSAGTNPFTAANVGQSMRLSCITGAAGIPGRYAIASTSGDSVTFTVAAWPASGSGMLTLYGWNYIKTEYTGTTATNAAFDSQRRGWNSGDTTATINTTASPGHVGQINYDVNTVGYSDGLVASNTGYQWTTRASRIENVPDVDTPLYLFIVVQNGSTAPASTTTWTIGFVQVEDQGRQKVRIASSDPVGSHALPVQPLGGTISTVSTVSNVAAIAAGANAIGDVGVQYRANATGAASITSILSPVTPAGGSIKASAGRLIGWQLQNSSTGVRSVKFYNATAVTMGTTAAVFEVDIPAGGRSEVNLPGGIGFATGIMWAVTAAKGLTDNTTTGLAANDVSGCALYA